MKYLITILFLPLLYAMSFAQRSPVERPTVAAHGTGFAPGRTLGEGEGVNPAEKYSDSVQFKAEFKELYALIKPTPTVSERAERSFESMSRMFKARGVDSVATYDSVMKVLDQSMDEKILYETYRRDFSAEELKPLIAFFKTSAGKHYLEIEGQLMAARSQAIDGYVRRTITSVITPMMKPMTRPQSGTMGRPSMRPGEGPLEGTPPIPPPPVSNGNSR